MPDPKHLQKVAVLVGQVTLTLHRLTLYCCRVMMMILPQVEKRMQVTQMMRRLYHKVLCHCSTSLTSDSEDAHKAITHEAACKSDVQYGNWQDEQICQGKEGIAQHDKGVNDYANGRKPCKAPDKIGPPIAYMEEHRVFKPLDTIANPLGLCQFYRTMIHHIPMLSLV